LSLEVSGANTHDMRMAKATLKGVMIARPSARRKKKENLCADKGYDYEDVREVADQLGYEAHIKARGEEIKAKKNIPGYRARRWVVERTHSWINRFRRLLIRWEKKVKNYLALLHFAAAHIVFKMTGGF